MQTVFGAVKGKWIVTANGSGAAFLGIPYAAPPIGDRRFTVPDVPHTWEGVRNATEFGPRCLQMSHKVDIFSAPPSGDSEDCLTLNLFTRNVDANQNHPVMVFIHGGSFHIGSSYDYGVEGIVENLVTKDVVVVVIQYRLGVFGFLATDDPAYGGNWGLWDQVEALKWVKDNVLEFGGDSSRVTIFGESAGAVSVSLLSYIPAAQDYFHQAIEQSGSGYTYGVLNDNSVTATLLLAEKLGCENDNEELLVNCLRDKPAQHILDTHRQLFELAYKPEDGSLSVRLKWNPRIDGYLIPDSMKNLAMTLQPKPTIIGTTNLEMAYFVQPPPQMEMYLRYSPFSVKNNFSKMTVVNTINSFISKHFYPSSADILREFCYYLYLDSQGKAENETFLIQQYIELLSDVWFHAAAAKEANDKVEIGSPIWMYSFDYYNEAMFPKDYPWKGALHTADLLFLFNIDFRVFKFERTRLDENVSETISRLWTNFAKFGDPQMSNLELEKTLYWPEFRTYEDSPTLHIGERTELRPSFHQKSSVFWNKLVRRVNQVSQAQTEEVQVFDKKFEKFSKQLKEEL